MTRIIGRGLLVALVALLFTLAFFFEYRTGPRQVHVPYDLDGYHYPLADYAFQSLRSGRFPEWDPTMYSGLPFAANVQAALFYPPMWLVYAFDWAKDRLSYRIFQDSVFLHVWACFVLCWFWFRWKRMHWLAAALGGGVFAFNAYVMHQLQHFGLVAGYAWMPLGFWGIDQMYEQRRLLPAWKLVAASALCFLAGYTPFWVAFCFAMAAYAAARSRPLPVLIRTLGALAVSVGICAVQLLPAIEASASMIRDFRYGPATTSAIFYLSWLVPNYFNFALSAPVEIHAGMDMLYIGSAGLAGLILAFLNRGALRDSLPAFGVFAVSALFALDPFRLISEALSHWMLGAQLIRGYYFLAGMTAALAIVAANGLNGWISKDRGSVRWANSISLLIALAAIAWGGWLIAQWRSDTLAHGWASAIDGIAAVLILLLAVAVYPRCRGVCRAVLGVSMLLSGGAEYKAFGTSKRVNAAEGGPATASDVFSGVDPHTYAQVAANPAYRVAIDVGSLFPTKLRHLGLTTPQGFDPFLPAQYKQLVESEAPLRTDREFEISHEKHDVLRLFGVRYYISSEYGPRLEALNLDPAYSLLQPATSYFKIFELRDARPQFGWEKPFGGEIRVTQWTPERRGFNVHSPTGGVFRLAEQFYPGWFAYVDGKPANIERCHHAFQCVSVPTGEHRIEFTYAFAIAAEGCMDQCVDADCSRRLLSSAGWLPPVT